MDFRLQTSKNSMQVANTFVSALGKSNLGFSKFEHLFPFICKQSQRPHLSQYTRLEPIF